MMKMLSRQPECWQEECAGKTWAEVHDCWKEKDKDETGPTPPAVIKCYNLRYFSEEGTPMYKSLFTPDDGLDLFEERRGLIF